MGLVFAVYLNAGDRRTAGMIQALPLQSQKMPNTKVALIHSRDRSSAVPAVVELLLGDQNPVAGKRVLLKPNFNTSDPFPGSTHNDTLIALIRHLQELGAHVTVGDRSGPVSTARVFIEKDIHPLCERLKVKLIDFDCMPAEQWVQVDPPGSHWKRGFAFAKPALDADCVVSTCCLKTHGFGGVFTISLKLAIGLVHRRHMRELHTSFRSMRKMIAEANYPFSPCLIVLDAIEAFTDAGPMTGTAKRADLVLAGTDRVAIDAVGIAILKLLGSNRAIMQTPIFGHEQITRAMELGLGVAGPGEIELVPAPDKASQDWAARIRETLDTG